MAVQLFEELIDESGHLEIPAGTRKILPGTLLNCDNLTSVVIPEGVTIVGNCSFRGCKNLRHVKLPAGLRTIDAYAFSDCPALESIVIPYSVRIIAHGAFEGCTGLAHIVIPGSVKVIGERAFEGCTCFTEKDISFIASKELPYDTVSISNTAYIVGSKEAIVRVINQAFRLFGRDKFVVGEGDGLEEINEKINDVNYRMVGDPDLDEQSEEYGTEFTLLDFLDDNNRMHSPCKDFVLSYIDEAYPNETEDYSVCLVNVAEEGDEYIVKLESVVDECKDTYWDEEWWDWCERMVRLYGCKVVLHREEELYGFDIDDKDTRLFELDGDVVKQTMLDENPYEDAVEEPESSSQTEEDEDLPF